MNWEEIIVHHAAGKDGLGVDIQKYRKWHMDGEGWRDIGYHLVVEKINDHYEVVAGRPLWMPGSHCRGHNTTALGICFAGNYMSAPPPEGQLDAGAAHIAGWCSALGIPVERIHGHKERSATACPGNAFPLALLKDKVRAILEGGQR